MEIHPLDQARAGERALTAHPRPRPVVAPTWRQRLRYFTGRHLTRSAFELEHHRHDQHLGLVGLRLGAGVVDGLGTRAVEHEGHWHLTVAAGHGLLADGRGVTLDRQVDCLLEDLPVADPESDQVLDHPARGLGLLVLQPTEIGHLGTDSEETSHCIPTEADLGWSDLQRVDATRLAFLPLEDWPGLVDLPPTNDARVRNRLAYALFNYEAQVGHLPGSDFSLPIAALAITPEGQITVCDRHAAWRALAVAPRRIYDRRSPALGQARILQFADELTERTEAGENMPGDLQVSMRHLPPVALLPAHTVNWQTRQSDALPPNWTAQAMPVSNDQLEGLLDGSRDLDPLDVEASEQVQLLIPVPAEHYDPELLHIAAVDPQFAIEIQELTTEVRQARSDRDHLDAMAGACLGNLSSTRLDTHPDPTQANEHAKELQGGTLPPPQASITDYAAQANERLQKFIDGVEDSFSWSGPLVSSLRSGDFPGLEPWYQDLESRLQATDDAVDQYFLSLRADIHRVRQVLGGTDTASRIGTSPVLSEIAEGAKGLVDPDKLQSYFKIQQPLGAKALLDGASGNDDKDAEDNAPAAKKTENTDLNWLHFNPDLFKTLWATTSTPKLNVKSIEEKDTDHSFFELAPLEPRKTVESITAKWAVPQLSLSALPWIGGSGGTLRTRQLVDRVRQPPAIEAKIKASATKARILRALADSDVVVGDIPVVLVTGPIALLDEDEYTALKSAPNFADFPDFADRISATSDGDWASVRVDRLSKSESQLLKTTVTVHSKTISISQLLSRSMRRTAALKDLSQLGLIDAILQGVTDPDPLDGDESDYVSTAVNTLEGTVSVLRDIEGRLHAHRLVLKRAGSVVEELNKLAASWLTDLANHEAILAEVRHDLTVAVGLEQEEQRRVTAVNAQRLKVLTESVEVVAVCRPRHVDLIHDLPSTELLPRFEDPLPQIFTSQHKIPDELAIMIDVVRHVPLGHLPDLAGHIARVDRRERMLALFRRARERAKLRLAIPHARIPQFKLVGSAAQSFTRLTASWQDRQQRLWQRRTALIPERLAQLSWTGQQREAIAELSLEDLLDGGRDAGSLTQAASTLIDRIGAVVGAIYHHVTQIDPMLRLRWVERVSIHDDPANLLQPPAVLPDYLAVETSQRRQLDHLIGYLDDRFGNEPEAKELASDLIRAAILVAARAPAAELAQGHLEEEVRGAVGDEIDATIGSGVVRIGMIADFTLKSGIAASGKVVDLLGNRARLQITSALNGQRFTLPAGTALAIRSQQF